jgi:hypothetical protein
MLGALVSLVTGYLQAKALAKVGGKLADYVDDWFRLIASVIITTFVTLLFTWGATAVALWKAVGIWVALGVGFATALVATAAVVYTLWTRSPLTKGIAIAVPSQLARAAEEQNVTITERK